MPFKRFSRMHNKLSELNAQNAHFGASLNRRDFTLSQYGTKRFGYSNKRKILSTSLESLCIAEAGAQSITTNQPPFCITSSLFSLLATLALHLWSHSLFHLHIIFCTNNRSFFRYASFRVWNQLPASVHQALLFWFTQSCQWQFSHWAHVKIASRIVS